MQHWWRLVRPTRRATVAIVGCTALALLALVTPLAPGSEGRPYGTQRLSDARSGYGIPGPDVPQGALAGSTSATTTPLPSTAPTPAAVAGTNALAAAFASASRESSVPVPLLEAICYMEGRLSNHGGSPSIDNGFGCMHLVNNSHADTLDEAAKDLGVPVTQLKQDIATNVRGGAAVLRDRANQFSPSHTIPASLADWYGAVAAYSGAATPSTARMYADAAYAILNAGFSAQADHGRWARKPYSSSLARSSVFLAGA